MMNMKRMMMATALAAAMLGEPCSVAIAAAKESDLKRRKSVGKVV